MFHKLNKSSKYRKQNQSFDRGAQQTGTGKTFTMTELADLFFNNKKDDHTAGAEIVYEIQCFEVLHKGNTVFDLLNMRAKVKLLEDAHRVVHSKSKRVRVAGNRPEEAHAVIREAMALRMSESTERNANSSRSHAFFIISKVRLEQGGGGGGAVETLRLVDLAGSERNFETQQMTSAQHRESANINASLMVLKNCLRVIAERGACDAERGAANEPSISANELSIATKKLSISAKEPSIAATQPSISAKEPSVKNRTSPQKSPSSPQKSPPSPQQSPPAAHFGNGHKDATNRPTNVKFSSDAQRQVRVAAVAPKIPFRESRLTHLLQDCFLAHQDACAYTNTHTQQSTSAHAASAPVGDGIRIVGGNGVVGDGGEEQGGEGAPAGGVLGGGGHKTCHKLIIVATISPCARDAIHTRNTLNHVCDLGAHAHSGIQNCMLDLPLRTFNPTDLLKPVEAWSEEEVGVWLGQVCICM